MKRTITTLVLGLALVLGMHAQKTYVLLAGIASYGTGNSDHDLTYTVKDVKELKQVFSRQANTTVGTITGRYVSRANIKTKAAAICKLATANDKIVFFFSGHGGPGGIYCYGGETMRYEDLADCFAKAKTSKIFCFIDACHSGTSMTGAANTSNLSGKRPVFMTACRPAEVSLDMPGLNNGIFTQALLKGLRGMADADANKQVTLIELFKYIYNDVMKKTQHFPVNHGQMHPQLIGNKALHNTVITRW